MGNRQARTARQAREGRWGHVYVLTNPAMPGVVKIGRTGRDVMKRLAELNSATGVPVPFRVAGAVRAADPAAVESAIHFQLRDCRVSRRREFFRCSPEQALAVAREAAGRTGSRFLDGRRFSRTARTPRPPLLSALAATAAGLSWICLYSPALGAVWAVTCLHAALFGRPGPLADVLGLPASLGPAGLVATALAAAAPYSRYAVLQISTFAVGL